LSGDLYKKLTGLIEESGGEFVRPGKGSHKIWKGANGQKTSIPKPCKRPHTANKILKELGLDKAF